MNTGLFRTTTGVLLSVLLPCAACFAQAPGTLPPDVAAVLLGFEGKVEVRRRESTVWDPARTNHLLQAGDIIRTGLRSRGLLRLSNLEMVPLSDSTSLQIEGGPGRKRGFELLKGLLYFLHRDRPDAFDVRTPQMSAIVRGTEFALEVAEDGTTTLSLIEGAVSVSNAHSRLDLTTGQEAIIQPGQAPRLRPLLDPVHVIQWCLYYPAVLNADELGWGGEVPPDLSSSLTAYRQGDLLAALAAYPEGRQPGSDRERVYLAALLLSVGQVREAESMLDVVQRSDPVLGTLVNALRQLIAVVKTPRFSAQAPGPAGLPVSGINSATALLARSYAAQAELDLAGALAAARRSTEVAPDFSFAWVRRAELEFGFGRIGMARRAIERALQLSPRHAQAHAIRGFLLAAENRVDAAESAFDKALALDAALGNGWLGRGLCRIRQGQLEAGRQDLQAAAAVEPNRALFRSYLGKAFEQVDDEARARRELELAQRMDAGDPTAWLYRALLNQQQNRMNEGIRDLEHAQELGGNRAVYRSTLLLDQDAAVRGANLATLYRDAGMNEVSVREAARAAAIDYANYSAHLFLGNSFNELRDPRQFNLRYETAWLSEFLVANLLAPPGAGTLSPLVTQQEYARLFDRNRLGLSSATEYRSQGDWLQTAVQHGTYENFSYAAEVDYRSEHGHRPNNDVAQLSTSLRLKQQVSPADILFVEGSWYGAEGGDVRPLYREARANLDLGLRTEEVQKPLLLAGLQHQWSPGVHTLVLGSWVSDRFTVRDPAQLAYVVDKDSLGAPFGVTARSVNQIYHTEAAMYSAEIQQIVQHRPHTAVFGGRYQTGDFDTANDNPNLETVFGFAPGSAIGAQRVDPRFERASIYGYYYWQPVEPLTLIGGLAYDHLRFPQNFRYAPVLDGEQTVDQFSPKAGLVWTPVENTTLRAAFARARGGVAFDQSFQLEPSQLAGFIQSYRSVIPEAVAGANAAPRSQIAGLALDQKFPTGTYAGLSAERLESDVHRITGVYDHAIPPGGGALQEVPSGTRERFAFLERSLTATIHQLLGREWAFGASYRLSHAELSDRLPDLAGVSGFSARSHTQALLHQLNLRVLYTHPSGFFGQFESVWSAQDNDGYSPALPGDDFWQFHAWLGYRFPRRRAEIRLGVVNLTDRNYRLNPLNLVSEQPHRRTLVAGLKFNF